MCSGQCAGHEFTPAGGPPIEEATKAVARSMNRILFSKMAPDMSIDPTIVFDVGPRRLRNLPANDAPSSFTTNCKGRKL